MSIEIYEWSMSASNNGLTSPEGAHDNWTGKQINDWGRETMAVVRRWYDDPEWLSITNDLVGTAPRGAKTVQKIDASSFRVVGCDATAYFTAGRRVRMREGVSPPYVESHIVSSSFATNDTTVELVSSNVPDTFQTDGADVYFAKAIAAGAFIAQPAIADVKLTAGLPSVAATAGWLECDGAEYLRSEYPGLALALGATGSSDGYYDENPTLGPPSTDSYFRVPDLRGRVPVGFWDGEDPDGDYDYVTGDQNDTWGGEKKHTLLLAEMAAHDHGSPTSEDGIHDHELNMSGTGGGSELNADRGGAVTSDTDAAPIEDSLGHTHTIDEQGTDTPHENRQPYAVMGYVIYSGVV